MSNHAENNALLPDSLIQHSLGGNQKNVMIDKTKQDKWVWTKDKERVMGFATYMDTFAKDIDAM